MDELKRSFQCDRNSNIGERVLLHAMPSKKLVILGLLGTQLDRGIGPSRWEGWRPSVSLCQQDDLLVSRFELLHDRKRTSLANTISEDIATISPETEIRRHSVEFQDRTMDTGAERECGEGGRESSGNAESAAHFSGGDRKRRSAVASVKSDCSSLMSRQVCRHTRDRTLRRRRAQSHGLRRESLGRSSV